MNEEWKNKCYLIANYLERILAEKIREWRIAGVRATIRINEILAAKRKNKRNASADELGLPVEFYFREVVEVFADHASELGKVKESNRILNRFSTLRINAIRNALSHKGEVTRDDYRKLTEFVLLDQFRSLGLEFEHRVQWVDKLNLEEAEQQKLVAIDRGEILLWPPDEVLPNNLPETFDHSATGLIGRTDEIKALMDWVTQENSFPRSIVAPGGYGKTALALEFLRQLSQEGGYLNEIEGIVFVSFKEFDLKEQTDYTALRPPITHCEQINAEVLEGVASVLEEEGVEEICDVSDRRIVICLDNLENLVRKFPEFVEAYLRSLPRNWKVLMTSRVALLNTEAHKLDKLSPEASDELCRKLVRKTFTCDESYVPEILRRAEGHPLAIIRSVYLVSLGFKALDAIERAADEVARFSFDAITTTFTRAEKEFLCAVELADIKSRVVIGEISGVQDEDEFVRIFRKLSTLRCVHERSNNGRSVFELEPHLSTYINNNDELFEAFSCVARRLEQRLSRLDQNKVQLQSGNVYERNYILPDCPAGLTEDIRQYLKLEADEEAGAIEQARRGKLLVQFCSNGRPEQYDNSPDYHFYRGKLYRKRDDRKAALDYLRVLELHPGHVQAKLAYSAAIIRVESDKSAEILERLIVEGLHEPKNSSFYFAEKLLLVYFQALVFSQNAQKAIDFSDGWQSKTDFREIYANGRIIAHARLAERCPNPLSNIKAALSDFKLASELFPVELLSDACNKLLNQITSCLGRSDFVDFLDGRQRSDLEDNMRWLVEKNFRGQTIKMSDRSRSYLERFGWFIDLMRFPGKPEGLSSVAAPLKKIEYLKQPVTTPDSETMEISIQKIEKGRHFLGVLNGIEVKVNWNSLKACDREKVEYGTRIVVDVLRSIQSGQDCLTVTRANLIDS